MSQTTSVSVHLGPGPVTAPVHTLPNGHRFMTIEGPGFRLFFAGFDEACWDQARAIARVILEGLVEVAITEPPTPAAAPTEAQP